MFDQVGGAGRGSFNHRFGQQSRDQLQHFNILYPVDMFPFTDADQLDPETGLTDGLLARATRSNTVPKFFHVLTNSEYFNRAGSLVHTDVDRHAGRPAARRPAASTSSPRRRTSSARSRRRRFGDTDFVGRANMNPLVYTPVIRALFRALDRWITDGVEPPPSRYPRLADGTLTAVDKSGWPAVPGYTRPQSPMTTYRLDFGPDWSKGIVTKEPPGIGKPFVGRVPAVDEAGNDRAGIRLPEIAVPLATHTGWNYRQPAIGAPDRLASEIGSYLPLPRTRADRERTGDGRKSIAERYASREDYLGRISLAAVTLVDERFLLAEDVPDDHRARASPLRLGDPATLMTGPCDTGRMISVADQLRRDTADRVGRLSVAERIALALAIGDETLRCICRPAGRIVNRRCGISAHSARGRPRPAGQHHGSDDRSRARLWRPRYASHPGVR